MSFNRSAFRRVSMLALSGATLVVASGCGSSSSTSSSSSPPQAAASAAKSVSVALILKNFTNPFFVAMKQDAQAAASKKGVKLDVSAGKQDGDTATQITAIENAVSKGDKGILITPNGPAVNAALRKARAAGLFAIALDTPPDPPSTVDITFATDNLAAGKLIGKWTAAKLGGKPATIAMLDLFNDQVVSVDLNRDHGFLQGMGIDPGPLTKNGGEASSGKYSGGTYKIACHQPTQGAIDGGRTAMETCLSKNPDINVVYAINEPAAAGGYKALKAAGKEKGVLVVGIDGGCDGVNKVKQGIIGATSQQYPGKMAALGVDSIYDLATKKKKPETSPGLDFFNTGVKLVTDEQVDGLESVTSTEGAKTCWGTIGG